MTKAEMARQIWLLYFNSVLKEQEVITDDEYRKMKLMITGGSKGGLR